MKLYLLMGQSNMAGRGEIEAIDRQIHPRIYSLDSADEWIPAREPIHFDKPHLCGTGPALAFGRIIADTYPDVTIGLIPCAMGGSTLRQWRRGDDLYNRAMERARIAMQTGAMSGMLWHQGESDAMQEDTARDYGSRLSQLIQDIRGDLDYPELAVVVGQIGDFSADMDDRKWTHSVNQALVELPGNIPYCVCVSADGLEHNQHDFHFTAQASRELGRRYACAMLSFGHRGNEPDKGLRA